MAGLLPGLADTLLDSPFQVTVGQGRLAFDPEFPEQVHWVSNPRDLSQNASLPYPSIPPEPVRAALDWVFGDSLPIQVEAALSTAVLLQQKPDALLIHLVNYNVYPASNAPIQDENIALSLTIPNGRQIQSVQHLSPDLDAPAIINDWNVDGSRLEIAVDELQCYSVVVVSFTD